MLESNTNKNEVFAMKKELERIEENYKKVKILIKDLTKQGKDNAADILVKLDEMNTIVSDDRPLKVDESIYLRAKFTKAHNLHLPLETLDDFKEFENKLEHDENNLTTDLVRILLFS